MLQREKITSPPNEWRNIPFHLAFSSCLQDLLGAVIFVICCNDLLLKNIQLPYQRL